MNHRKLNRGVLASAMSGLLFGHFGMVHAACGPTISTATVIPCALANGDSVTVTETGSISVVNPQYGGIFMNGANFVLNGITVNGTVAVTGGTGGANGYGIFVNESLSHPANGVVNNGITVNGLVSTEKRTIYLNDITVNGGITVGASGHVVSSGTIAINIVDRSVINGGITNLGVISAGSGQGITMSSTIVVNDGIQNYGTIFGGGGTGSYAIGGNATVNGGIVNNAGADIIGRISSNTSDFTNNGTFINKLSSSMTSPDSVGTPAFSTVRSFTQGAGGLLRIVASGKTTPGTDYSSVFAANGNAVVGGGIHVDVRNTFSANTNDRLASVISASGQTTNNISSVTDNSLRYAFTAVMNGTSAIDLVVTDFGLTPFSSVATTGQFGMATVIDNNSTLGQLLGNQSTTADLRNTLAMVSPLLSGNSMAATQGAMLGVNRIVQARIDANSSRSMSSGGDFAGDRYLWAKPYGSRAEQDDRNGVTGYNADSVGVVVGMDGAPGNATRLGAAFAYARMDLSGTSNIAPQSSDVSMVQLIAYGSHALDDRTEINFQAGVGHNTNKSKRQIALFSSTAAADYDSLTSHVGAGVRRTFPLTERTSICPAIRADYLWVEDDGYVENGAGQLNLKVDSRRAEAFILSANGRLVHQFTPHMALMANAGVGYDTVNKPATITSAFAGDPGASFVTYGIDPDPWIGLAGIGIVYGTGSAFEVVGRYDAEYRQDFLNQTASLKVRWRF